MTSAAYVLFVNAHPICTPVIKLAQQFHPSMLQIVDTRSIQQRPPWLVGVPTLISTRNQGPILTGAHVMAWLESCRAPGPPPAQSTSVHSHNAPAPQAPSYIAPPRAPQATQFDQLFQNEFDRQDGAGVFPGGGTPGQIRLQEDNIGNAYVGGNASIGVSDLDPGVHLTM